MQKKQAVAHVVDQGLCSVRRACHYLDVYRSTYRYQAKPIRAKQRQLHQRIVALSWQYPRYGYRRIRALLAQEGWPVSRKQVQRIRRKEGLKVRPKPNEYRVKAYRRACLRRRITSTKYGLGILFSIERIKAAR